MQLLYTYLLAFVLKCQFIKDLRLFIYLITKLFECAKITSIKNMEIIFMSFLSEYKK